MAATPGRPAVTIAVVSYNTRDLLLECLQSLEGVVSAGLAEVWVIDNASSDGSAEAAGVAAPWARVRQAGENLGFGRAVNLVAGSTESEWLACANADVALESGALEALLAEGSDPAVACLAPRLVLPDGTSQSSLHNLPTLPFSLAVSLGLYKLAPSLADRMLMPGRYDLDRARDVPWAIAAFLLVRRAAFDRVGGFDERLWMYAEDLDLGWRLREAGYRTRYVPQAHVRHHSSAAAQAAFGAEVVPRFMRSTYAVLVHRRGRARAALTALVNVAGAALRVAWMAPLARLVPGLRVPAAEARMWLRAHVQGLRLLWTR
jgi:N-acetylglucosaminyl-diphospho-decaprenol L-rhamnosyltransferase